MRHEIASTRDSLKIKTELLREACLDLVRLLPDNEVEPLLINLAKCVGIPTSAAAGRATTRKGNPDAA